MLHAERLYFLELCEFCLWGNATDLSLLTRSSYEDIQKLQGSEARKASKRNIIANDLDTAFNALLKSRVNNEGVCRVDIVLDNSGFDLFTDRVLAGYLLSTNLVTSVVLHPKKFPWFVSDVTPKDLSDLLASMADPLRFYKASSADDSCKALSEQQVNNLKYLAQQWNQLFSDGKLTVHSHGFWTTPSSYWNLPSQAPNLFKDHRRSDLVLFKGDSTITIES